jgi:hypothetical protein
VQGFAQTAEQPYSASAKVSLGHDDNLQQTDDKDSRKQVVDSAFVNLTANGDASFAKGQYKIGATLDTSSYIDSPNDNYTDTGVKASANYTLSKRASTKFGVNYARGHDPVGDTDRASSTPETWDTVGVNAGVVYGREESKGRVEATAGYLGKRYDEFSSPVKTEDTNTASLIGTFYYKIQPKTELLFELSHENIDYVATQSAGRDNQYQKARVGAKWQATAKTSGTAKVGYARKDFEQTGAEDANGLDWEVGVDWEATPRSLVSLTTSRSVSDTTSGTSADYITTQNLNLSVVHDWTRKVKTTASVGFSNDEYGISDREEDTFNYSLGAEYLLNSAVSVGGLVNGTTRDSSAALTD